MLLKRPFHLLKTYLAKQYAKLYPQDMFVGITGSVGKTSCVAFCKAVLAQKYRVLTTKYDADPALNIPATLLKLNPRVSKVILEMGIQFRGDMDFYLSQVKPKIVIVTKIAYAHSDNLGDLSGILEEKGKLVESLGKDGIAILNYDDANCRKLAEKTERSVIFYGTNPQNCKIWAGNIKLENYATNFELNMGVERVKVNLKLLGAHHVYQALAAACLGIACGISLTKIKIALESIEALDHQLQVFLGPNDSVIIDDTINLTPAALDAAIDVLLGLPARRRILVLGEMKNLGSFSESLHRSAAQKIYKEKLDFVFLGAGDTKDLADELKSLGFWEERMEVNLQSSQIVSRLLKLLGKGDICLVKGSKAVRFDEIVKRVAKSHI